MEKQNNDNLHDDRLEFNDGVGDMLRPKEKEGFGWFSTVLIVGLSLIVILLSFWISFNVGKKIFLKESKPDQLLDQSDWDSTPKMDASVEDNTHAAAPEPASQDKPKEAGSEELLPPEKTKPEPAARPMPKPAKVEITKPAPVAAAKPAPKPVAKTTPASVEPVAEAVVEKSKPVVHASAKPKAAAVNGATLLKVVAGSFADRDGAKNLVTELSAKGVPSFVWAQQVSSKTIYRIQVGAFQSSQKADALVEKLKGLGYDAYVLQQ